MTKSSFLILAEALDNVIKFLAVIAKSMFISADSILEAQNTLILCLLQNSKFLLHKDL